jgi:hypothetical protein
MPIIRKWYVRLRFWLRKLFSFIRIEIEYGYEVIEIPEKEQDAQIKN